MMTEQMKNLVGIPVEVREKVKRLGLCKIEEDMMVQDLASIPCEKWNRWIEKARQGLLNIYQEFASRGLVLVIGEPHALNGMGGIDVYDTRRRKRYIVSWSSDLVSLQDKLEVILDKIREGDAVFAILHEVTCP
jgi:hypothetical protein